jgi:serine/threonine protein kinase/tetratricopeptide (TPR) repeat protein
MKEAFERELAVFSAARRLPPAERPAYLDQTCAGDPALRQRVEELLRAGEDAEGFLQEPAPGARRPDVPPVTATLALNATTPGEKAGDRIGHYKLLQQIGEGGCGLVYMAEQEEPVRRRVALKVIKLGMDTKQVIARFEAERQALAMMDHPNIAKVLDAGATGSPLPSDGRGVRGEGSLSAGRPYFVMELVRGIKITEYCDEHNLPTKERLELFIQVCHALQHAHQKGIIHRDLKPSNILVASNDGVPVPKVIDFGIAKATQGRLTDQTLFTAFEQFIGTPAYMSPEQAELTMQDVDTRTDIYSLGVLLYELLTGKTPFDAQELLASGLDAMRRTIREQEPVRPSTKLSTLLEGELTTTAKHRRTEAAKLVHLLRGDLDWIVMKCLEKDRARRYDTANGLARDVQRHLNCEPVVARPPSRLYEFQKTVRRHKVGFAATAALIAVLAAGVIVSTSEAIRATRAEREQSRLREAAQRAQANEARQREEAVADKKKAETEAARSAQVASFMQGMLQGVGPSVALGRDTKMLREILDQTASRLNDLKGQPAVEADLRATLGRVYADLGEYTNAASMHQKALALRRTLYGDDHSDIARSLNDLAEATYQQGNYSAAEALQRQALAMRRKLFGDENLEVAQSLNNLAESLRRQGFGDQRKLAAAEPLHREALATRRKLLGNENLVVAESLYNLGSLLWRQGKYPEAESAHREALAIRRKLLGAEHPEVAASLDRLGLLLDATGRHEEAEKAHREALAMRRKLLGSEHPDVAHSLQNLAGALIPQGKVQEAEPLLKEALAIRWARLPADHTDTAQTLESLVNILRRENKAAEIETLCREQLKLLQLRLGEEESRKGQPSNDVAVVAFRIGRGARNFVKTALGSDNLDMAQQTLRFAVAALERAVSMAPTQTDYRLELFWAYRDLFGSTGNIQDIRQAIAVLDRALEDFPDQRYRFVENQGHNYRYLAFHHANLKEYRVAREALASSTSFFREMAKTRWKATGLQGEAVNFQRIGDYWTAEGRTNEAHEAYRRSLAIHELIEQQGLAPQITTGWIADHYSGLDELIAKVATPEDISRIAQALRPVDPKAGAVVLAALAKCHLRLADVLREGGKLDEAAAQVAKAQEITASCKNLIDLSTFYNAALTERWHGPDNSDLSELPSGIQTFAGVQFDVRGLIQLAASSGGTERYPKEVRNIPINRACHRLHFLHAAIFGSGAPDGAKIGSYVAHYASGKQSELPIIMGESVADWWNQPNEQDKRFTVAWVGQNADSRRRGRSIRLFKSTWENPTPSETVSTIDFIGFQQKPAPFLVAITAEP